VSESREPSRLLPKAVPAAADVPTLKQKAPEAAAPAAEDKGGKGGKGDRGDRGDKK